MSISKFQDKFLSQKGCATAIAVGTSLIMSMFLFQTCSRNQGQGGQEDEAGQKNSIATVGSVPVSGDQVTAALSGMMAQQRMMGSQAPAPTFAVTASMAPYAVGQVLNSAAMQTVAEQNHISLSDDAILAAAKTELAREQPPSAKPDPKKDEQMKAVLDRIKQGLSDPQQKATVLNELLPMLIQNGLLSTVPATPADVRKSYDSYEVKRIYIANRPGVNAKAKADEVLKALKGGMSFEAAMDKYSNDLPQGKGKKISDAKMDLAESQLSMMPNFKVLDGKPAGFVSDALEDPGGLVIYKVVGIQNKAPKDFATNQEKYKKQYAQTIIQTKVQDQVKGVLDSSAVKWNSAGYKAVYDLSKATQGFGLPGHDTAVQKVIDEAKASLKSPADKLPALYAWFDAETILYNSPTADKVKLRPDRIELLKSILQTSEDYTLRMELADLYVQQKDGTDALQNLVQASQANTTYDVTGQDHFRDIGAKGASLVSQKLVTADALGTLNTAQAEWKKGKADSDKMEAQMKSEEAKQKIQDAANQKANEELIKKQKAQAGGTPGVVKTTVAPPSKPGGVKGTVVPPSKPVGGGTAKSGGGTAETTAGVTTGG